MRLSTVLIRVVTSSNLPKEIYSYNLRKTLIRIYNLILYVSEYANLSKRLHCQAYTNCRLPSIFYSNIWQNSYQLFNGFNLQLKYFGLECIEHMQSDSDVLLMPDQTLYCISLESCSGF